jgi:hypothetical protein
LEKFENTKSVIRNRTSKTDRQYNAKKIMDKKTKLNIQQNEPHIIKNGDELRCFGKGEQLLLH